MDILFKRVYSNVQNFEQTIGNRTRPRALVQNQHTREVIRGQKMSHKHNNKDLNKVPLVEFMYLVFTHMPGESFRRRHVFGVVFV